MVIMEAHLLGKQGEKVQFLLLALNGQEYAAGFNNRRGSSGHLNL
jgi:hypothetical protein